MCISPEGGETFDHFFSFPPQCPPLIWRYSDLSLQSSCEKTFPICVHSGRKRLKVSSWAESQIQNENRTGGGKWVFSPSKFSIFVINWLCKKCKPFKHHLESSQGQWKVLGGGGAWRSSPATRGHWLHHLTLQNLEWLSPGPQEFSSSCCRFDLEHPELGGRIYQPL